MKLISLWQSVTSIVVVIAIVSGSLWYHASSVTKLTSPAVERWAIPVLYAQSDDYPHLQQGTVETAPSHVYGMIVSHHHYVEELIAKRFRQLNNQIVRRVVVLSPNHFLAGSGNVITSGRDYDTAFGRLKVSTTLLSKLSEQKLATINDDVLKREHGVLETLSYIKKVLPEAEVMPIVVRHNTSPVELDKLERFLVDNLTENDLVVASVDFSHHMTLPYTRFHDAYSVSSVKEFDLDRVKKAEVDSTESLEILLTYLQTKHAMSCFKCENPSYAVLSGEQKSTDNTSYLFATFVTGPSEPPTHLTSYWRVPLHIRSRVELKQFLDAQKGFEGNELRGFNAIVTNATTSCEDQMAISVSLGVVYVPIMANTQKCLGLSYASLQKDPKASIGYIFDAAYKVQQYDLSIK